MSALCSEAVGRLLALPPDARKATIKSLPPDVRQKLIYDFDFWARPNQIWRPGPETYTVYLAGRGWGKNHCASGACNYVARHPSLCGGVEPRFAGDTTNGVGGVIGIAGRTANDVNETMLYGPSGIITLSPPWFRPIHHRSRKILEYPNGVIARLFSGDVPASFRGPNIGFLIADELAHWPKLKDSWSNARLTLRHGVQPRALITSTPIGVQELIELVYQCRDGMPIELDGGGYMPNPRTRVVHGSSYDNAANVAASWLEGLVAEFEGGEIADQEIRGVLMLGAKGALWKRDWIQRIEDEDELPKMAAVVVAIDPTVSDGQKSGNTPCECGIVAAGLGDDGKVYILEDGSGRMSGEAWAKRAYEIAVEHGADWIAYEENQGGDLVALNLQHHLTRARFRLQPVRATRNKAQRASLVAGLWQAGRVVHVGPTRKFLKLEHQLVTFDPNRSEQGQPSDRMDAVVWAVLSLLSGGNDRRRVRAMSDADAWRRIAENVQKRMQAA